MVKRNQEIKTAEDLVQKAIDACHKIFKEVERIKYKIVITGKPWMTQRTQVVISC